MTTKCDPDSTEIFSNAEFYHLRNCLVELIEELKLRRSNDTESEERIKLLVNEKYELERKYDGEQGKRAVLEEQHEKHIVDMERSFQERMRLIEEENKQLKISRKCVEKETDALKDSVRSLQLAKYSLEKSLRDQEHKLQSHLSSSDQQLAEISALEQKMQSMTCHFQQLSCSHEKLAKNVMEAVKLNRSLMYVNEHQKCVMQQQKTDLHQCQQCLIQLSTKQESPPASTVAVEDLQQKLAALQYQIKITVEQKEVLEEELEDNKIRHQKTLTELQETHSLVCQHLDNANQHREKCAGLEQITESLKSCIKEREELVDKLHQELDVEKTLRSEALAQWTKQEEMLTVDLGDVKRQLVSTEEARRVLEEQKVQLQEFNVMLTNQYQEAKAILDIEKKTAEQQTSISHFSSSQRGTQTDTNTADISVQTFNDITNSCIQTVNDTSSSSVQTECPHYVSSMSQTIVPPLANCSVQTMSMDTLDKEIQAGSWESEVKETCVSAQQEVSESGDVNEHNVMRQKETSLGRETQNMLTDCDGGSEAECSSSDDMTDIIKEKLDSVICEHETKGYSDDMKQVTESKLCQNIPRSPVISTLSTGAGVFQAASDPGQSRSQQAENGLLSIPLRGMLPVARHSGNQSNRETTTQRKNSQSSEKENSEKVITEKKIASGLPVFARSRSLYTESQLLWGSPANNGEPKDWCKKSRNPPKQTSNFALVSETWEALLSAKDEKEKSQISSGRSPRSKLKMGLKVLSENSPSRPRKLAKPMLAGLENEDIAGIKSPVNNMSVKSSWDSGDSSRNQRCLKLRQSRSLPAVSTENPQLSPQTNASLSSALINEPSDNKIPGRPKAMTTKGILKVPSSAQKSSKSVRFESVVTTEALIPPLSSTSATNILPQPKEQVQTVTKPSGEVLLFSDEDEEQLEFVYQYDTTATQSPVLGDIKKRKLSGTEDQ